MSGSPNWAEVLSAVSTAGQFFVVLGALWYAHRQLHGWRNPTLLQRRASLAIDILLHANKLKEELLYVRRKFEGDVDEHLQRYGNGRLYAERIAELRDLESLANDLASDGIKQKYIIGSDRVDGIILDFIKCEEKLKRSFGALRNAGDNGNNVSLEIRKNKSLAEHWTLAIEQDRDTDRFRDLLRTKFSDLEKELKPLVEMQ